MFYKHPSIKPDGVRKQCNDCRNAYRREAHKKDPSIKRNQSNKFTMKNKDKINAGACKKRKEEPKRFKNYSLKKNFGITIEEYDKLHTAQNHVCAICKKTETALHNNGKPKDLAVDHCHNSGRIRGLLCWRCNTGIGKLYDNPEILRKAADYIEKSA
jgi:hypothetical protein